MARFRGKAKGTKTVNLAGGQAFKETDKLEFASILLTSFVQDQFYRSANETVNRISELISGLSDKKFAAKSAIYARTKYGMRSVSHVVAGEIAKSIKGEQWTKNFFDKVVYRPDDMLEILSYYFSTIKEPSENKPHGVPKAVRVGFGKALGRFDEYSLAKYRGENSDMKLVDLVNLVHPKPTEKNAEALKKLIKGELKSTGANETWETKLTDAGQKATTEEEKQELKSEAWKTLLKEKKLKYFAALRNCRNILEQSPESVDDLVAILTDSEQIKKSLVLPFRYLTAIKEIDQLSSLAESRKVLVALNKAVDIACANVPVFDGSTLVVLDTSGSMISGGVGGLRSTTTPVDIGSLFTAILAKSSNADVMLFSEKAKYVSYTPTDSILSITKNFRNQFEPAGTNFHAPFQTANKKYDRIIILSDMQGWMRSTDGYYCTAGDPARAFSDYKKAYSADPKVYSFDLQGYGTLMFPERNVFCFAGFSEKVFDIMKILESDKDALIKEIEKIEL